MKTIYAPYTSPLKIVVTDNTLSRAHRGAREVFELSRRVRPEWRNHADISIDFQVPKYKVVIHVTPKGEDNDHIPPLKERLKSKNRFAHVDLVRYDPEGTADSLIDYKHLLTLPDIYFSDQLFYTIVNSLPDRFEDLSFIQRPHVYFFTDRLIDYVNDRRRDSLNSLEATKNPRERKEHKDAIEYYARVIGAAAHLTHGRNLEELVATQKSRPENFF